jgi:dimethylhistidine N-methyltransferase
LPIEIASHAATDRLTIVSRPVATGLDGPPFAEAVRLGLLGRPKTLPWQYFYDEVGSNLFERICRLPEYYLTRTEDAILREHADAMVDGWDQAPAMIELGSGSSSKTRRLIAAAIRRFGWLHYIPIDVSPTILAESARTLASRFPALRVTGYVANYRTELARVAAQVSGPKLWVFLGSSLGNYDPEEENRLLAQIARASSPADRLLLGTDLDKDPRMLEAAYDDAQGITAQFNRNLLVRINRELGADFVADRFAHRAVYRREAGRVEMHLVSRTEQVVRIPGTDPITVRFAEGESIHTENSHKYTPDGLRALARRSGYAEEAAWRDAQNLFRVQRWRPLS